MKADEVIDAGLMAAAANLREIAQKLCPPEAGWNQETGEPFQQLAYLALANVRDGHTYLPAEAAGLAAVAARHLAGGAAPGDVLAKLPEVPALAPMVGDGTRPSALVVRGGRIYTQKIFAWERSVVALLRRRARRAQRPWREAQVRQAASEAAAEAGVTLAAEQRAAVVRCLRAPLTVLAGGPGTGKTTVAAVVVRAAVLLGLNPGEIMLAAPTGKAADRLQDAVVGFFGRQAVDRGDHWRERLPPARTLHRLLGISPGKELPDYGERLAVPARVIIADEASMIELGLFRNLLAAAAEDAVLVIIGDPDQLPAVNAPAPFGAVVRALRGRGGRKGGIGLVELARNFRLGPGTGPRGGNLEEFVGALRREDPDAGAMVTERPVREALGQPGAWLVPGGELGALLEAWYDRHVGPVARGFANAALDPAASWKGDEPPEGIRALWARVDRARLLVVTNSGPAGNFALNRWFANRVRADLRGEYQGAWLPGMPVMAGRNDYELELFNGDAGVVVAIAGEGGRPELVALFGRPGQARLLSLISLRQVLVPAYAVTVHKSQGSEYDEVGLVLPATPHPLVERRLLYTAVTRARKSVVIGGPREVLEAGLAARFEARVGITAADFEGDE